MFFINNKVISPYFCPRLDQIMMFIDVILRSWVKSQVKKRRILKITKASLTIISVFLLKIFCIILRIGLLAKNIFLRWYTDTMSLLLQN